MFTVNVFLTILTVACAGPATELYKDQYCTDPRTMRKHPAYTEWADAYSCTRHRCQPGGRNLAIYTVGCKRVEAPESAIECEEVVEDTNMQFPYCCTRLRCLVVVRGEVWTRVLGQPWETLPAAPWSHMYKMKKPPPANGTFLSKSPSEGPIYELQTEGETEGQDKVLRSGKKPTTETPDCSEVAPRAAPAPDIVIALSTNNDQKEQHTKGEPRHRRGRKAATKSAAQYSDDEPQEILEVQEPEEIVLTEKPLDPISREEDPRYYANSFGITPKAPKTQHHQVSWTEIPQSQWNEHDPLTDSDPVAVSRTMDHTQDQTSYHQSELPQTEPEKKPEDNKPGNLQALVDAIGTRMRDIENVVQRMSDKVHKAKTVAPDPMEFGSGEKNGANFRAQSDSEPTSAHKHHEPKEHSKEQKTKKPNPDAEHYKRFSVRNRGSKYLHSSTDGSTEPPLFVEDTGLNGYFNDASNSVVRRAMPKEPPATYMAPVENRKKIPTHITVVSDVSEDVEKKHKKHSHKKKRVKGHHKKHHGKDDKRKRFNRINSVELDRNVVSLEDSSAVAASK